MLLRRQRGSLNGGGRGDSDVRHRLKQSGECAQERIESMHQVVPGRLDHLVVSF